MTLSFGILMNESHDSLCRDYEVTGAELDTLVYEGRKPGRGGYQDDRCGFGGCTVSIVEADHVDEFISRLGEIYTAKTGLTADFYLCRGSVTEPGESKNCD